MRETENDDKEIEVARSVLKKHGYLVRNLWHKDDIITLLDDLGHAYDNNDVLAIIGQIEKKFDANVGINFDSISYFVWDYFRDKVELN